MIFKCLKCFKPNVGPTSVDLSITLASAIWTVRDNHAHVFLQEIKYALNSLVVKLVFRWRMQCYLLTVGSSALAKTHSVWNHTASVFKIMEFAHHCVDARIVKTKYNPRKEKKRYKLWKGRLPLMLMVLLIRESTALAKRQNVIKNIAHVWRWEWNVQNFVNAKIAITVIG